MAFTINRKFLNTHLTPRDMLGLLSSSKDNFFSGGNNCCESMSNNNNICCRLCNETIIFSDYLKRFGVTNLFTTPFNKLSQSHQAITNLILTLIIIQRKGKKNIILLMDEPLSLMSSHCQKIAIQIIQEIINDYNLICVMTMHPELKNEETLSLLTNKGIVVDMKEINEGKNLYKNNPHLQQNHDDIIAIGKKPKCRDTIISDDEASLISSYSSSISIEDEDYNDESIKNSYDVIKDVWNIIKITMSLCIRSSYSEFFMSTLLLPFLISLVLIVPFWDARNLEPVLTSIIPLNTVRNVSETVENYYQKEEITLLDQWLQVLSSNKIGARNLDTLEIFPVGESDFNFSVTDINNIDYSRFDKFLDGGCLVKNYQYDTRFNELDITNDIGFNLFKHDSISTSKISKTVLLGSELIMSIDILDRATQSQNNYFYYGTATIWEILDACDYRNNNVSYWLCIARTNNLLINVLDPLLYCAVDKTISPHNIKQLPEPNYPEEVEHTSTSNVYIDWIKKAFETVFASIQLSAGAFFIPCIIGKEAELE